MKYGLNLLKAVGLALSLLPLTMHAQRAYKPLKAALKAKNYAEAVKQVGALRADTSAQYAADKKLCKYSVEAYRGLNDKENVKLYLKQPFDTTAFYHSTQCIVMEALRIDSLDRAEAAAEGQQKLKETAYVTDLLQHYYPNIRVAARYYYKCKKWNEAMKFLQQSLDIPQSVPGAKAKLACKEEPLYALRYLNAAYAAKRYDEVGRYSDLALTDTANRRLTMEVLANTAAAQDNKVSLHYWLKQGWTAYPSYAPFFTRLVDYYAAKGEYGEVVRLADKQLQVDSLGQTVLLARSASQLFLENYEACLRDAQQVLATDTANVEALYYAGASLMAQAVEVELPEKVLSKSYKEAKQRQVTLLKAALPYLEKYRALEPQKKERWAPLLYKEYLLLNMGKKFAEIEPYMH